MAKEELELLIAVANGVRALCFVSGTAEGARHNAVIGDKVKHLVDARDAHQELGKRMAERPDLFTRDQMEAWVLANQRWA
jgi:hypothetical protein